MTVTKKNISYSNSKTTAYIYLLHLVCTQTVNNKGGFKSEDTGEYLLLQNKYSKSLSWAENLNKLFTVLGGKFKFSAQDSNLEYLFWRSKNPPVSSDLKPPLTFLVFKRSPILQTNN